MNSYDLQKRIGFVGTMVSKSFDVTIQTSGADDTFTLPLVETYTYDAVVDWGDDSSSNITAYDDEDITHTYSVEGSYMIKITGTFEAWSFNNIGDKLMATAVHFGSGVLFKYLLGGFYACSNLNSITGQIGDDSVTSFEKCFRGCVLLASIPTGLFNNNTSVTSFRECFGGCLAITSIPTSLFDNNTSVTSFEECFANTDITSIPSGLFDNNTSVTSFEACFSICTSLTGSSGEPWLNPSGAGNYTLSAPDYDSGVPEGYNCYAGSAHLSDYATIPTYWK